MTTSVLIVEDEPSILELISYTCRTSGMEVRKAANVAEVEIPCDVVIVAIGQKINTDAFAHVIATERGRILANDQGALADHNGLFAGGDAVTGPATVIRAIAAGKVAAANIDEALGFHHNVHDEVTIPAPLTTRPATGRVEQTNRRFAEAIKDFDIAKNGMTQDEVCLPNF